MAKTLMRRFEVRVSRRQEYKICRTMEGICWPRNARYQHHPADAVKRRQALHRYQHTLLACCPNSKKELPTNQEICGHLDREGRWKALCGLKPRGLSLDLRLCLSKDTAGYWSLRRQALSAFFTCNPELTPHTIDCTPNHRVRAKATVPIMSPGGA